MRNEPEASRFAEKAGRLVWPAVLLVSAILILLFAAFASSPFDSDFSFRDPYPD